MAKRKIILTQKQLDEIVGGGNSGYFDNSEVKNYSINTNADGYGGKPTTTDDVSKTMPTYFGKFRCVTMREDNERLKHKTFGSANGEPGKSYDATKMTISRANAAKETMQTGATQDVKDKAAQTLQNMQKNNNVDLQTLGNQYKAAKSVDKSIRKNKVANGEQVLKSAPKNANNGKAHSIKTDNAIINFK